MGNTMDSKVGRIHRLAHNPRTISDGAYTLLVESLGRERDIDFLRVKKLVVWKVPAELDESRDWPFSGQEGKLVMLGGNQRFLALQELGYDRIPDEWLIEGKHEDGEWWTAEEAERFILLDNNPEGISGETDYNELVESFNRECLKAVGMDFAQMPVEYAEEDAKDVTEDVETDEHGERDEKLEGFIERREKSRGNLDEILDVGFYATVIFETYKQKMMFVNFLREKFGIEADREMFLNGFALAKAMGLEIPYSGLKFPTPKPETSLQEMAMDGTSEGWEVAGDGVPEGEDESDDYAEKVPDGSDFPVGEDGI